MSWIEHQVTCPADHPLTVRLPTWLEVRSYPDDRADLLEGRFGQSTCPTCGSRFAVEQPLAYADFVRFHFLLVFPASAIRSWGGLEAVVPGALEEVVARHGQTTSHRFQTRLAFGYEHLREKLTLWDAGMDDRVVEALKLTALQHPELGLAASGRFHLILERIDLEGSRLIFLARRVDPPHLPERVFINFEAYEEARANLAEHESSYPELFACPFVNALRYLLPAEAVSPARARR